MLQNRITPKLPLFDERTWGLIRAGCFFVAWAATTIIVMFFVGRDFRFILLPVILLGIGLWTGGCYIQSLYTLNNKRLAFQYLFAVLFGTGLPELTIEDGRKKLKPLESNLLDIIGGPGFLVIEPGTAVVSERADGTAIVRGAGRHYIARFETIKEIISLEEQQSEVDKVTAISRDGIPVEVQQIRFRYTLESELQPYNPYPDPNDPFPLSAYAALNMVYNRNLDKEGKSSWHDSIKKAIQGTITDYISEHTIDDLIVPTSPQKNPRLELSEKFKSKAFRDRLSRLGAQLLWIDIGHFALPEKMVSEQHINLWQARWDGDVNIIRAFGEAQQQAYQEMGRAEGQAEMLISIIHAMDDLDLQNESRQQLRLMIISRLAQLLDRMNQQPPASKPVQAG
jgi:regulator of protease activity HflC (stomatin/prohibitin superfamily)